MAMEDARQLLRYAVAQLADLGLGKQEACWATLLLRQPVWSSCQALWSWGLTDGSLSLCDGDWMSQEAPLTEPLAEAMLLDGKLATTVKPWPKWLGPITRSTSGGFLARTQSQWSKVNSLVQAGLLASRQLAGSDASEEQHIVQKAGFLSDLQMITLSDGKAKIEQKGGWQNDQQTVIASAGQHEIHQTGGRGRDVQRVQVESGSHKIHQVGGHGSDGQKVTVYGDGDNQILLEGGTGEDTQEVYLRGVGSNSVVMLGGAGNDTLKACGGYGSDTIVLDGGEGDDLIVYRVAPPFTAVGRAGRNTVQIRGGPESSERNCVLIYQEGHPLEVWAGERRIFCSPELLPDGATRVSLEQIRSCRIVLEDLSVTTIDL
jgi:hypothetical protein